MTTTAPTATRTAFLVVAPPQPSVDRAQEPAPPDVSAWNTSLATSTASLTQARAGKADPAIVGSVRAAAEAALNGSLAALEARLRTLEDGETSALLASVGAAYAAFAAAPQTTVDTAALAEVITDFRRRCAQAEGRWMKGGKAHGYRAAFASLVTELAAFPELARKIGRRREDAIQTRSYSLELQEFRINGDRTITELSRLAGLALPAAVPPAPKSARALGSRPSIAAMSGFPKTIQELRQALEVLVAAAEAIRRPKSIEQGDPIRDRFKVLELALARVVKSDPAIIGAFNAAIIRVKTLSYQFAGYERGFQSPALRPTTADASIELRTRIVADELQGLEMALATAASREYTDPGAEPAPLRDLASAFAILKGRIDELRVSDANDPMVTTLGDSFNTLIERARETPIARRYRDGVRGTTAIQPLPEPFDVAARQTISIPF